MFYSPEAYTYGGLFIAFLEQVFFFFLLRNVMFLHVCHAILQKFPGEEMEEQCSSFYLICKNQLHLH